ncbi:hypothetical protein ASU31_13475 [Pedobacter ginsenosidimutans]|uniref:Uncharacterized protein n=1 Tax=Pedobacter ginsenosidimutans TaxID=687842 RepID=A0A0T5VP86_9SPHI|nr:hypothetical protein [Pedobacter ginsenosidimutans]KRT15670.1 hypothetical protein ASU31_13475 [Pedobacter ginsenosidimutans]
MTKREEYNLFFKKSIDDGYTEYGCYTSYTIGDNQTYERLAAKLTLMHRVECEGLIESIIAAQSNKYYEQYFAIDSDSASDDDGIEIAPPNVIIDGKLIISFTDMIQILDEWIDFINK